MLTLNVPMMAYSVFETDVLELAEDPEAFGLDEEETRDYRNLAESFDLEKSVLRIPTPEVGRSIYRVCMHLANTYDAVAEGEIEAALPKRDARAASRGLGTLAAKALQWAETRGA